MIIQVRLNENDQELFKEIKEELKKNYTEIFGRVDEITNSEAIRACIRRTHLMLKS